MARLRERGACWLKLQGQFRGLDAVAVAGAAEAASDTGGAMPVGHEKAANEVAAFTGPAGLEPATPGFGDPQGVALRRLKVADTPIPQI